jgi:hypothetical protein
LVPLVAEELRIETERAQGVAKIHRAILKNKGRPVSRAAPIVTFTEEVSSA